VTSRKYIMTIVASVGIFLFFLLSVFGDKGFFDLYMLKQEKTAAAEKTAEVVRMNLSMAREIDRLKYDLIFIENVARRELGMIRKDELILRQGKKP
jgi:cell division protein FtsB